MRPAAKTQHRQSQSQRPRHKQRKPHAQRGLCGVCVFGLTVRGVSSLLITKCEENILGQHTELFIQNGAQN